MPESITLPTYPFVKPVNAKGYVARAHSMYDVVVTVIPEGIVAFEEEVQPFHATVTGSGEATIGELGRTDAIAPSPSAVVTETPSVGMRVS